MKDYIFEFKKDGKPCGFLACSEKDFMFKPDKYRLVIIPLEVLKKNLRSMVKAKRARIITAGIVEAVVVPEAEFLNLFI